MTWEQYTSTLSATQPPRDAHPLLSALWWEAKGKWDKAHDIVQDIDTRDGAWIHAYLHRKEGDLSNAGYWYKRAGQKIPSVSLQEEWEQLSKHFLLHTS